MKSRLHKDLSILTNELLKDRTVEAIEFANKIISDGIEELAEQISILIKK